MKTLAWLALSLSLSISTCAQTVQLLHRVYHKDIPLQSFSHRATLDPVSLQLSPSSGFRNDIAQLYELAKDHRDALYQLALQVPDAVADEDLDITAVKAVRTRARLSCFALLTCLRFVSLLVSYTTFIRRHTHSASRRCRCPIPYRLLPRWCAPLGRVSVQETTERVQFCIGTNPIRVKYNSTRAQSGAPAFVSACILFLQNVSAHLDILFFSLISSYLPEHPSNTLVFLTNDLDLRHKFNNPSVVSPFLHFRSEFHPTAHRIFCVTRVRGESRHFPWPTCSRTSYLTLDSELSPPLNLMLFMKQHPMHAFRPELRMPPPLSPEGQPVQPPQEKSFVQKYWVYMAIGLVGLCECFFSSLKAAPSSRVFFFFLCGLLALQTITTRLSKNPLHLENKLVYPS